MSNLTIARGTFYVLLYMLIMVLFIIFSFSLYYDQNGILMLILDLFQILIISSTSLNINDYGYAIFAVFPYIFNVNFQNCNFDEFMKM